MNHISKHPFHLVEPSPWPLFTSLAVLLVAIGAILWMHHIDHNLFLGSFAFLIYTLYGWWRDVIAESGEHTSEVRVGLRYGVILLIISEVMFFFGFFWGYFHAALDPTEATGNMWPPKNIELIEAFDLPYLNTLILMLSSITLSWAHKSVLKNHHAAASRGLFLTIALGLIFTALQAVEYGHAPFSIKEGIYPSLFYIMTGFHGIHVIIGTIFLFICWLRLKEFTPDHHIGLEAATWYWHFVDVVWILLFVSVYVWP